MSGIESLVGRFQKLDNPVDGKMLEVRKSVADDIVKKLGEKTQDPMLLLWQEIVSNYLISTGFLDEIEDSLLNSAMKTGGITPYASLLGNYRDRLNNPEYTTESAIVSEGEKIMQEIDQLEQSIAQGESGGGDSSNNGSLDAAYRQNIDISEGAQAFYNQLEGAEKPDIEPFFCAFQGYGKLKNELGNPTYLTVVDFRKSNKENRMYVINMATKRVEHAVQVGHGKNSGGEYATKFSDKAGSNQSSLGFYRTPQSITKAHTKSWSGLWLKGIESSNDNAKNRGIYMHPGGVNGSQGCFTLPRYSQEIMEKIKGDSLLFAYYPESNYFSQTKLIDDKPKVYAA